MRHPIFNRTFFHFFLGFTSLLVIGFAVMIFAASGGVPSPLF